MIPKNPLPRRGPRPVCISFLTLLLASCTAQPTPVVQPTSTSTVVPTATATNITHAPEIRFALIGEPRDVNVWELFDESGASYADYALRAEYWPRLYHLAPPELIFQALAADGDPSAVTQDGQMYSATVKLRMNLKWTDGTPFTAEDVAFTINRALEFELGFDWSAYYPRDYLDHAEAMDAATVKFIFKKQPNVGVWQYAALQGPIVQKAFWEPLIKDASALLPDEALRTQVQEARVHLEETQSAVDDLTAQLASLKLNGQQDRKLEGNLATRQNELTFSKNNLDKLLAAYDIKIQSAHQALYALDDANEPTLGTWIPAEKQDGAWVNVANPDFPFAKPNFDRAVYHSFSNEQDAERALTNKEVDMILEPRVKIPPQKSVASELVSSLAGSARFLLFNPTGSVLVDPALRQALTCMISISADDAVQPLSGFVLPGNDLWRNSQAVTPCSDFTDSKSRLDHAVQVLRAGGYTWQVEPTIDTPGSGLSRPTGAALPPDILIFGDDPIEAQSVNRISDAAWQLGFDIRVVPIHSVDVRYAVLSSKKYDMAILGWNLSLYPGYLCEWFGMQGQFDYGSDRLHSECEALAVESDLKAARKHIFEIQSLLASDLPFIPFYADITYDSYRNVHYPFETVLGGLGGLYGAPSYAMP